MPVLITNVNNADVKNKNQKKFNNTFDSAV